MGRPPSAEHSGRDHGCRAFGARSRTGGVKDGRTSITPATSDTGGVLTCCVQTPGILERPHCRPRRQPMVIALAARLYNEQGVSHNAPPQRGSRCESARSETHRALTTPLTQRHARTTEGIPCEHTRMIARRALRGRQGRGSATPARIYARFMWQNECKTQVIAHAGARTPHSRSRPLQQCTCTLRAMRARLGRRVADTGADERTILRTGPRGHQVSCHLMNSDIHEERVRIVLGARPEPRHCLTTQKRRVIGDTRREGDHDNDRVEVPI
jgi:hypothetical protein